MNRYFLKITVGKSHIGNSMSKIFCISYSDYGYLLTQTEFLIKTVQLTDILFENILISGEIEIRRRFVNVPRLFDDDHSEPLLTDDTERFSMKYMGIKVKVIDSYKFTEIAKNIKPDPLGFVKMDEDEIPCESVDQENLAEDLVLLASNGIELNDISLVQRAQGV